MIDIIGAYMLIATILYFLLLVSFEWDTGQLNYMVMIPLTLLWPLTLAYLCGQYLIYRNY